MSVVVVRDGGLVLKDPVDAKVYQFDWDAANLAPGVTIISSVFAVVAISPSVTDAALTVDQVSVVAGLRKTQFRLNVGTLGQLYEVFNTVVTSETPAQTKRRSFLVQVEAR